MLCEVLLVLMGGVAATPLVNGDFERGLEGWGTQNSWYERPKGSGLAKVVVAPGEGRDGGKALKIIGEGKRNLALQALPAYPGRYRVTGWIKCEKLDAGQAGILLEWMGRENKWMRGDWAGHVSGTRPWQHVDAVLDAPPGTRSVHFDLIVTEPNHGAAWFDDIRLERLPSDFPAPQAPTLSASTPAGEEGCLEARWDPTKLAAGTCRLLIYCEAGPRRPGQTVVPKATADSEDGRVTIRSLDTGKQYQLAAVAVNADGKHSAPGPVVRANVTDRQAPRPGWLAARAALGGDRVTVSWSPHVLDGDVKTVHIVAAGDRPGELRELAAVDAAKLREIRRPFYCTEPRATAEVPLAKGRGKVGAWCEDRAGNRGQVGWAEIEPASASEGPAPCALWTIPPTMQIRRDAKPPANLSAGFDLLLMRGQAKGFQLVVRPEKQLRHARLGFAPLAHEGGKSQIEPRWLAYHFVDYVRIEKNSRATPKEELVWPGPAEYPDPLSDDLARDLPAEKAQPIYVRVTAPRDAKPGLYRGRGWLESDQGKRQFVLSVHVSPVVLPEKTQLKFVYWFSWDAPCREFGVEQYSADGWRALGRLGELMLAHHQNAAVVPWSLVATWRKPDGSLVHDFRDFDRYVATFQAAGVDRLFCLSHVGGRTTDEWECPTMSSHRHAVRRLESGEPETIDVIDLLPALQQHLEAKGWLDRFVLHVADEPIAKNVESYRQLAARARKAAPRLRRIDAIHVPNLQGSLEVFVPQLNYFEQWLDQYRAIQRAGNELWFYIAWVPQGKYPNRMIDSQAIKSRVLHWLNAVYDTSGYLHWALNHWQIPLTSLESPGDQYICWPSRRYIANGSLRYEAEREGLEDCELMFMLRDALEKSGLARAQAQKRVEEIARRAVRSIQDYTRLWRELEAVREELLRRTAAALAETAHLPVLRLTGDWEVEASVVPRKADGTTTPESLTRVLKVAPSTTVTVTAERYDRLPLFQTEGWAGWTRGVTLKGVRAQECTNRGLLNPASLELRAGPEPGATRFELGKDYGADLEYGAIGRLPNGRIRENQPVFASYRHGLLRIDAVVLTGQGEIILRQGEPHAAAPLPPAIKRGERRLANIYVPAHLARLTPDHLFPMLENAYPEAAKSSPSAAERLLPKTLKKLREGDPLRILAWGDSVTVGTFVPDFEHQRWQEQFVARLRKRFPRANITLVTEAWGGRNTSSYLDEPPGSPHNYREKVLGAKPDLVVSEFVNDAGLSPQQVQERYGRLLEGFRAIGAEWIILTPHYVRPDWMGLAREREIDEDPRPYVAGLRQFAAARGVALADASLRWGRLWRRGIPYSTLMLNSINHPDARGMELFADSLMTLFP